MLKSMLILTMEDCIFYPLIFLRLQYNKIRNGLLRNDPEELIKDWVVNCIDEYIYASTPSEVSKQVI
ncbi:hypothetical protein CBEIBR21_01085 [Clostridium beijerinckii]|uniref:Uncharacterized protein n=2 Tax=Clostridium beijerinckii TaxID=1520 RepID=A0A1S9NBE5_CLOBE|nr:hypothetical protein CBEIBR21_01085 [Clostridium beijerinckii]